MHIFSIVWENRIDDDDDDDDGNDDDDDGGNDDDDGGGGNDDSISALIALNIRKASTSFSQTPRDTSSAAIGVMLLGVIPVVIASMALHVANTLRGLRCKLIDCTTSSTIIFRVENPFGTTCSGNVDAIS